MTEIWVTSRQRIRVIWCQLMEFLTEICNELRNEEALQKLWANYIKENIYAAYLSYQDVVDNVLEVGQFISE